jgi:chloramphenicol 3-O-phosphotransferase
MNARIIILNGVGSVGKSSTAKVSGICASRLLTPIKVVSTTFLVVNREIS